MLHSSIGQSILPKAVLSRALSLVREQRNLACPLYFLVLLFTHSDTAEKYRRSSKLSEVYCISLKLVKSKPSDLPHGLPLYVNQNSVNLLNNYQADSQEEDSKSNETSGSCRSKLESEKKNDNRAE